MIFWPKNKIWAHCRQAFSSTILTLLLWAPIARTDISWRKLGDCPHNRLKFNQNLWSHFRGNSSFAFGSPCEWSCTGHRFMTDKFMNSEHEQNPTNCSGNPPPHTHTHTYRRIANLTLSYSGESWKHRYPRKFWVQIFFMLHVWESRSLQFSHSHCSYSM